MSRTGGWSLTRAWPTTTGITASMLFADAWSRTYRSRVVTFSRTDDAVESRGGIRFLPDRVGVSSPEEPLLPLAEMAPASTLAEALNGITARYGAPTGDFVRTLLEYPQDALR